MKKLILTLSLLLLTSMQASAYLTLGESAEIPAASDYQIGFEPQVLTNRGGGANVTAFFDAPFNDATSGRLWLGAGIVDFTVGGTVKYIPFPDIDQQPGIGIRGGAFLARNEDNDLFTIHIAPMFSKKVQTDSGLFIPYAAIAINATTSKARNFTGTQMILGTEFKTPSIQAMYFGAEVGLDLSESFSYVSGTVTFPFDSSKGLF